MNSIPENVNKILTEYFTIFEARLPNLLEAYYIYGSISLGAFDCGFSDIDFIAVVKRQTTETDMTILKEIHKYIKKKFPKTDLMGLYVMQSDLQLHHKNEKSCPCFIDGIFKGLEKFDQNSIDAYQLKKYGITMKGLDIKSYTYEVDWDTLIQNMSDNLNTYWLNWLNGCRKPLSVKYIGSFIHLGMIEWGVLGVTRLYYTFKERDITSKVGAGEYALKMVPQRWHKIIHESMRLRKGNKISYYKSIFERRKDALDYIEFIIAESNHLFTI
ncbi:MAG TPA: aminoglycoside adenylyltransferase domain-containing protein [Patescibacteria group bacterium]|nr:aminoglycoside adenylyltransferase domain-containing protein [Patescibacteria group bacterium]